MRMIPNASPTAATRTTGDTCFPCPLVGEAEDPGWQADALGLELLDELRADAGGLQLALDAAVLDAELLPGEDVLHDDDVPLHALHLGDRDHLARAVLEPGRVDDQVDGRRDLLAD